MNREQPYDQMVEIRSNNPLTVLPSVVKATTITTAINPAIKAYSMAVAPSSRSQVSRMDGVLGKMSFSCCHDWGAIYSEMTSVGTPRFVLAS